MKDRVSKTIPTGAGRDGDPNLPVPRANTLSRPHFVIPEQLIPSGAVCPPDHDKPGSRGLLSPRVRITFQYNRHQYGE